MFSLASGVNEKEGKNPYCTRLAWQMAEISQVPVCPKKMFPSLGHGWGVEGHEVGVEVDNCQESGSVRVQGHSRVAPTSISVHCTLYTIENNHLASYICNAVHYIHCALLSIGSWHCTALHRE